MARFTLHEQPYSTVGSLPAAGTDAPEFHLTGTDLRDIGPGQFKGKTVILNIFPSIDTPVCAASVRRFNEEVNGRENTVCLCVSRDLPFAHERFCGAEGLTNVIPVSELRDRSFGEAYGVRIADGPMAGLFARAVIVIDPAGTVRYTQLVPEIAQEPDYAAVLAIL